MPSLQMVATDVAGVATTEEIIELTPADVPEMLELVTHATRPVRRRTIDLGRSSASVATAGSSP